MKQAVWTSLSGRDGKATDDESIVVAAAAVRRDYIRRRLHYSHLRFLFFFFLCTFTHLSVRTRTGITHVLTRAFVSYPPGPLRRVTAAFNQTLTHSTVQYSVWTIIDKKTKQTNICSLPVCRFGHARTSTACKNGERERIISEAERFAYPSGKRLNENKRRESGVCVCGMQKSIECITVRERENIFKLTRC